jgi:hypothetical protein
MHFVTELEMLIPAIQTKNNFRDDLMSSPSKYLLVVTGAKMVNIGACYTCYNRCLPDIEDTGRFMKQMKLGYSKLLDSQRKKVSSLFSVIKRLSED